jgi:hypothetical protein
MPEVQQSGLRDIHLPEAVSWWPPAPGWWGLLGLIVLSLAVFYLLRSWRKRRRLRNSAMLELRQICEAFDQHHDDLRLIRELSVLLRRIVISYFPRTDVASLTGDEWLRFLDNCGILSDKERGFQNGPGKILNSGPYQARLDLDTQALIRLCRRWVESLPAKPVTV